MENLVLSFNVVFPLFICIALGYVLRILHMLDDAAQKSMNKLCFRVFLPIYLFGSIYATDMSKAMNIRLVAFVVTGVVAVFMLLMILIPRIEKENPRRGVMVQAIFRSNFALFGLPVATALCGTDRVGPTAVLVGIIVPVYNVLAVVSLEAFRGGKPNLQKMIRGIAKNPLIIASILGIVMNLANVPIPAAVHKSVTDLGRVATPLSLVVLGGGFSFRKMHGYAVQTVIATLGRLVIVPLTMLSLGVLAGFRSEMLVPILAVFGSPVAVSSFTMAEQMDGDATLAGSLVVLTTMLSIVTMFLFIFGLKQLGYV